MVRGRADHLGVSPSGRLWLVTATGNTYVADSVEGNWRRGPIRNDDSTRFVGNDHLVHISFFDDSNAMITGYIPRDTGLSSPEDSYFLTKDGGTRWRKLSFGGDEWIYDVFILGDRAWMGGSGGSLFYSPDRGRSWEKRRDPFDGKLRTFKILMVDSLRGLVAGMGNGLAETRDNGRSWTGMPTPLDQKLYPPDTSEHADERIVSLGILGDTYLINQRGYIFFSPRSSIAWRPFPDSTLASFAYDAATGSVCGVTSDRRVVLIGSDMRLIPLGDPLSSPVSDLVCRAGAVYAMDLYQGIYRFDRTTFRFSYPLSQTEGEWPVQHVEQKGDTLIGSSMFHVYKSTNWGSSWHRVAVTHAPIRGQRLLPGGSLLYWDGHGVIQALDRTTGRSVPVRGLENVDVIDVIAHPAGWVAYGGMQYESSMRVDVARTFFAGEFAGTVDYGFTAMSRDQGATWNMIDRWDSGGVANIHVAPDGGRILLQSYLGSIRTLTKEGETYRGNTILQVSEKNWKKVPYAQQTHLVWFETDDRGYIMGWIHHLGNRVYRTTDGGRNWHEIQESEFGYTGGRHFGSQYVAWRPDRVDLLDTTEQPRTLYRMASFRNDADPYITNVQVTSAGTLVIGILDPESWTYRPKWVFLDPVTGESREIGAGGK